MHMEGQGGVKRTIMPNINYCRANISFFDKSCLSGLLWVHYSMSCILCNQKCVSGCGSCSLFTELYSISFLLSIRDYVQYWTERGVEVVGWTVNTAVEKDYYQNLLKIGYITDSLLEDCDPHYWMITHTQWLEIDRVRCDLVKANILQLLNEQSRNSLVRQKMT